MLGRRDAAEGSIRLGHGVEPAYFSQQEIELDERGSVLQCVQTMTGLQRPDAQSLLGRFLFSGLPPVAPYCVPGGVRVVSSGLGSQALAGSDSAYANAKRAEYARWLKALPQGRHRTSPRVST